MGRLAALKPWVTSPYAFITAPYLVLRVAAWAGVDPKTYQDTSDYLKYAAKPFFSEQFWAGGRSWAPVLFYRLLPDGNTYRSLGQILVSVACWLALAIVTARCIRRPGLRLVAYAAVLAFSLSIWIVQWDSVIVSESLAISLGAALVAAWLALVRRPGTLNVVLVLAVSLLWASTRDANSWMVLMPIPFVLVWLLRSRSGLLVARAALVIGSVAIFYSVVVESTNGPVYRGAEVLFHVVEHRAVKDRTEIAYFRDHGMPARPATYRPRNYVEWFRHHARSTLMGFLITHPYKTVAPVLRSRDEIIDTRFLAHYRARDARTILPEPIAEIIYPNSFEHVLFWVVLVCFGAGFAAYRCGASGVWLVPALLLAFQPAHALIAYHGDAWEVSRHTLLVGMFTRLSLVLLALFALDAFLGRAAGRRTGGSPAGGR